MTYTGINDVSNLTSFNDMLVHANTATSGTFWTGIYWMLIVIIMMSSMAFGLEVAIMIGMFGGLILGLFLLYLGLINFTVFGITEAILIFVTIYFMYSSSKNN